MEGDYYNKRQIIEIFHCDESFLTRLEEEDLIRAVQVSCSQERMYPPDQVERLRIIQNLIDELEVNLPGVEVIMSMRENMIRMHTQFQEILEELVKELKTRIPQ